MRAIRIAVLGVFVVAVTAGCTPKDEPLIGLSARDGKPLIVFVACDRSFAIVDVYEDRPVSAANGVVTGSESASASAPASVSAPASGSAPASVSGSAPASGSASGSAAGAVSGDAGLIRWSIVADAPGTVNEISVFDPPPGWNVVGDTLTELRPGVRYAIGGASQRNAIPVPFTTAELSQLDAEHVRLRNKTVPRAQFENSAKAACR